MITKEQLLKDFTPHIFYLGQNYPNPFKESTTIKYCIGSPVWVKLIVFNSAGEEIKILVDEEKDPGTYEVEFNTCHSRESLADGKAGKNPKSGRTYFYRLEAGDYKCEK